MLDKMA